ncbi:Uncharacterized protein TCM_010234 [Theobroma cacao]|uniref:Uncharacterized protein n=1 Tax=Theobroma cacao TaxID=3641 RepID=A0A061E7N1_THECC|nr:Uncharacterized protein TCM_010234 [Theobroma cacao]
MHLFKTRLHDSLYCLGFFILSNYKKTKLIMIGFAGFPKLYNCILSFGSSIKATTFMDENGCAFAVNMVSNLVNKLNKGVREEVENQLSDFSSTTEPDIEIQFISCACSPWLEIMGRTFTWLGLRKWRLCP